MYLPKPIDSNNIRAKQQDNGLYEVSYESLFHVENGKERIGTITLPNLKMSINSVYSYEQVDDTETIFTFTLEE